MELPLDQVGGPTGVGSGAGGARALGPDHPAQAVRAHEAFDRAAGHIDSLADQGGMDLAGAVDPVVVGVDVTYVFGQLLIAQAAGRRRAAVGGVIGPASCGAVSVGASWNGPTTVGECRAPLDRPASACHRPPSEPPPRLASAPENVGEIACLCTSWTSQGGGVAGISVTQVDLDDEALAEAMRLMGAFFSVVVQRASPPCSTAFTSAGSTAVPHRVEGTVYAFSGGPGVGPPL